MKTTLPLLILGAASFANALPWGDDSDTGNESFKSSPRRVNFYAAFAVPVIGNYSNATRLRTTTDSEEEDKSHAGTWSVNFKIGFQKKPWLGVGKIREKIVDYFKPTPEQEEILDMRLAEMYWTGEEGNLRLDLEFGGEKSSISLQGKTDITGLLSAKKSVEFNAVEGDTLDVFGVDWSRTELGVGESDPDERRKVGRIHLVGSEGLSIISDIDDTIKITGVLDTSLTLANTFLNPMLPVEGMSELYSKWQNKFPSPSFHYVSGSPYQLHNILNTMLTDAKFPLGSMHLRSITFRPLSLIRLIQSSDRDKHKRFTIAEIISQMPSRKFILIGDSTEHDPEIYAEIYRKFPAQIQCIFIRIVEGYDEKAEAEKNSEARFRKAFSKINIENWKLFKKARELEDIDVAGGMCHEHHSSTVARVSMNLKNVLHQLKET